MCHKNGRLGKSEKSKFRHDGNLCSIWLQNCLSKSILKPKMILQISLKRHPDGLTCHWQQKANLSKNVKMCFSKDQKLEGETQFGQVKNAFQATHSDSNAKSDTCFWCQIYENRSKYNVISIPNWIMRSAKKQSRCKLASKWLRENTYKTNVILHICSICPENSVFGIQWFITKMSTRPRAPWDHRMPSK